VIILDPELAASVGAKRFGEVEGVFAGGKRAAFEHGTVDSVTLGGLTVRNVPIDILSTKPFAGAAGGLRVDGILGTVFMAQFITTLDYPGGELILQPKTDGNLRGLRLDARSPDVVNIPFWMAGDHYMLAWGQVNRGERTLMFVDTGLAGAGFLAPDSTLKASGVEMDESRAFQAMGGGGEVKVIPFVVEDLALGGATERNISGAAGMFPPQTEYQFGFRIGGLISHQFFRPYTVTLDFSNMRLLLRRTGEA
jgi:hypothetical protein